MKTQKFNIIHALAIRLSSIKNTSKAAVRCAVWAFFIFRNLLKRTDCLAALAIRLSSIKKHIQSCSPLRGLGFFHFSKFAQACSLANFSK
jgi:hypothetical protein